MLAQVYGVHLLTVFKNVSENKKLYTKTTFGQKKQKPVNIFFFIININYILF